MNTQRVEGHTPTLKACPFCGVMPMQDGEDNTVYHPSLHYDKPKCILANMYFGEADWNKQANIERLEKVNEALVKCLESSCGDIEGLLTAIEQVPGITTDGLRESLSIYRTAVLAAKEPA